MIITIDGPVASGKSTTGRALAKKLGFYYVYSGAFYRALAYLLINTKGYTQDQLAHPRIEDVVECLDPKRFRYAYDSDLQEQLYYDDTNITQFLKTNQIDQGASIVSTDPKVRDEINNMGRSLAHTHDLMVDGRDAGTVIFPDADVKFFLTASLDVRARRWAAAQEKLGNRYTHEQALVMIGERDTRDRERAIAPLRVPDDAIVVDNSDMDTTQTLAQMIEFIK